MTRSLRLLSVAAVFALAACPKPTPPVLPDIQLGDTTVGISVSKDVHATGGTAPLTYAATGVPAGMTFDAGVLSGTPTAAGDFTLSVTVTDAEKQTATKAYPFKVFAAPVFTATGIPDGIVGTAYSVQFAMTGGKTPFLYVATALDLPPELTFAAATGTLAGTPATPGNFSLSLQVTDANGASVSNTFSAQIHEPLRIVTTTLPQGMVGTAYSNFVQALGGKTPIAFSISSGLLPPGLSIDSATGQISGTPTAAGSFTFTVQATDASSRTTTTTFTLKVFTGTPLQIATSSLSSGVVGNAYSQTLAATGGRTPYTWTASAGSLPAGITLSASGDLTGTPTAAGTSTLAITVTDADGQAASATLILTVYERVAVGTGAVPDGYAGDGYAFNFSATGGKAPYVWSVASGSLPTGLTLSNAGALSGTPAAAGTFAFTVQVADGSAQTAIRSITLSVLEPLAVGNASLGDGSVGSAYSQTLFATGGKAPYTFSVTGALPAGITATGAILSGNPTAAGTSTFTVTVTDGNAKAASKNLSIHVWAGLSITTGSLPDGYISVSYSQTLTAVGGTSPYTWSVTGTLPPGIALNVNQLTGTPTAAGTYSFSVTVTDAASGSNTKSLAIVVAPALTITKAALADGYRAIGYVDSLTGSGGKPPYTYSSTGPLPPGVTLGTDGLFGGSPTAAGTYDFTAQIADQNGTNANKAMQIVVYEPPSLADATFRVGTQGQSYTQAIPGSGGKPTLSYSVTAGNLPAGLSVSGANISGTPTTAGTQTFTVQVSDQNGRTASKAYSITINSPPQVSTTSLPTGYPTVPYSQALAATGGLAPYTWSLTAGLLPAGLTLGAATISGTPTTPGTSTFTVQATDSNGATATATLTITIAPAVNVSTTSVPDAYVGDAYSATLAATGGLAPYTWTLASGSPPPGIAISGSALTGTPTAIGTSTFVVRATDQNVTSATQSLQIVVYDPPFLADATFRVGTQGQSYTQAIPGSGGKSPLSYSVTAGSLPAGLSILGANISGTPTTAGTQTFTLQVADQNGKTASRAYSLTINPPVQVSTTTLPDGYLTVPYSQALAATGGVAPYTWSLTAGSLPAGLTFGADTISGTPTTSGTSSFTVQATDSNGATATATLTLRIAPPLSITSLTLPETYVGEAYSATLTAAGGLAPYTWDIASGSLPAGLTLSSAGAITGSATTSGYPFFTVRVTDQNGVSRTQILQMFLYDLPYLADATFPVGTQGQSYSQRIPGSGGHGPLSYYTVAGALPAGLDIGSGYIIGTPTAPGTSTFTIELQDLNGRRTYKDYSITINPPVQVSTTSLPNGYAAVPYSQTLAATGGVAPYTWSLTAGSLPAGLTLGASTIGGTPTTPGTSSFTVQATDQNGATATATLTIAIGSALAVTTTSVPDTYVGEAYSATLAATGGLAPYTWALASGSLPPGITLSGSSLLGTATAAGTWTFTIRATDQNSTTATQVLSITASSLPSIVTTSLPDASVGASYSQTLAATGGRAPYTWSLSSGALPPGLSLNGSTGVISGTPTGGNGSFSVTLSDAGGKTAIQALTINVFTGPTITTTGPLPIAYATESYSQTFTATGGAPPLTWSISTGAPAGLSMTASTGVLGGTVLDTVGNNFSNDFTVTVTDANSRSATASFGIVSFRMPQLTTTSVDTATEGITYAHAPGTPVQVAANLGLAPYTFSATGLPPGLAMSGSGIISGIPGQGSAGTYTVSVTITDANGRAPVRTLTMTVVAAAPIARGGWYSVQPEGSPITDVLTVFAIDTVGRPIPGIGIRIQKNGADFTPVKEALTSTSGKAFFSGLGLNGTTDTISLTGNGLGYENTSVQSVNAALITLMMKSVPTPRPRDGSPMLYDATVGKLLLFGGADMDINGSYYSPATSSWGCVSDIARLDTVNSAGWTEIVPDGMATAPRNLLGRQAAALAGGTEVFFGGLDCVTFLQSGDTWKFQSSTNAWLKLAPGMSPTPRYGGAMVAESSGSSALLFGGNDGDYPTDLWRYSLGTNSWAPLAAAGGPPSGREAMGYAMRTATGDFWICGGEQWGSALSDCWSYNATTNMWTARPALPQPRTQLAMAYDPAYDTLYVFGGSSNGVARNDLLQLPSGATSWTVVTGDGQPGAPSRRRLPQMAYVPSASELVVFGGINDNLTYPTAISDTWTFHRTNGWVKRNTELTPATVTLSGTISGGYPTGPNRVYMQVGLTNGMTITRWVTLPNGSGGTGQYVISGIPVNSTVALNAVDRSTSAGVPGYVYSFYSATNIGPLTGNTTHNIVFPGQMPTVTSTFTLLRPANWVGLGTLGGTVRLRQGNYPALRSGLASAVDAAAGAYKFNHYTIAGATNTADLTGQDNTPSGCEYVDRFLNSFTPGSLGTFQLPAGHRGMTPGQNPCTPEGTGLRDSVAYTTGMAPRAVAVGTFLGNDLALDAVTADSGSGFVTLFRGDGVIYDPIYGGGWTSVGTLPVGPYPTGLVVADLIGDSHLDLAVVTRDDNSLRIFAGTGDGFAPAADWYTTDIFQPIGLGVADVTGDGLPDLVVLNGNGTVVTYKSSGPGLPFTPSSAVSLGGTATSMALGDYSGDGVDDLAATLGTTGQVVLRRADPVTGAFIIPGPTLMTDPNPASVAFGDYSGDGQRDIVVGHAPGTQVLSFQNLGGVFGAPEVLPVASDVPAIGLRDLNGDGRADLVLATDSTQSLTVYVRNGGTWQFSENKPNWPAVKDLEITDVNADGTPDVLTANSGSDSFSTFIGQRPLPIATDPQFSLVVPADAKLGYIYRGTFMETYDWTMQAPAAAGPMTITFPPPSTLAPARPMPSGQRAHWDPNFYLYDAGANFNYHDTRSHGGYYGYTGTQTYGYVRQ